MKSTIEFEGLKLESGCLIAEKYGIAVRTIPKWVQRGLLPPPVKIGRNNYYDAREVASRIVRGE